MRMAVVFAVIYLLIFYRIFKRLGYRTVKASIFSIVQIVPFLGLLVLAYIAFSDWDKVQLKSASPSWKIPKVISRKKEPADIKEEEYYQNIH